MCNQHHLTPETPERNLVAGTQWLQATFASPRREPKSAAGKVAGAAYLKQTTQASNGWLRTG